MDHVKGISLLVLSILVLCILFNACAEQKVSSEITDNVISQFVKIAEIPRPSGHEEMICDYLEKWAKDRNLDAVRDEYNNLVFDVPATDGMENKPTVALQSHMDMVFAQEGDALDPLTTSIKVINDGEYLRADGTSLGADDGMGIAIILNIADGKMPHGPLRAIFTTDEEVLCTGANNLDPAVYSDIEYLINVDSETVESVNVSSAAGKDYEYSKDCEPQKPAEDCAITIKIDKLTGGHSGLDIGFNRLNAIIAMGKALKSLEDQGIEFSLAALKGGVADNVIPYSAQAVVCIANNDSDKVKAIVSGTLDDLFGKHKESDPNGIYTLETTEMPEYVMSDEMKHSAIQLICEMPDGIRTYSAELEGFPQTSSNLGVFDADSKHLYALVLARSSDVNDMEGISRDFEKAGDDTGVSYKGIISGMAWKYNPNSKLLKIAQEVYKSNFGEEIILEYTHGVLECGAFAETNPHLDMISIGPTLLDVHSVNEACDIGSIAKLWTLMEGILGNIE